MAKSTYKDQRSSEDGSGNSQQGASKVDAVISRRRVVQAGIGAIGLGAFATGGSEPALAAEDVSFNLPSGQVDAGVTAIISPFTVSWQELDASSPITVTVKSVPSGGDSVSTSQEVLIGSPSGEKQTAEMSVELPAVAFDDGVSMSVELSHPDASGTATATSNSFTVVASEVELSWSSNSDGAENGFRVYQSTVDSPTFSSGSGDFSQKDEVGSGTTTYTDSNPPVAADTTVTYTVTAFNQAGESNPSGLVEL